MSYLPPGSTIGILGAGQLGRMLALAARPLGYRVVILAPDAEGSPASQVADSVIQGDYLDEAALAQFAAACDVVTVEFENVPARTLELLAERTLVRPGARALHISQNRLREKLFLQELRLPLPRFAHVRDESVLPGAIALTGLPAVLKTAGFGYDGKGQVVIRDDNDMEAARKLLAGSEAVLEELVTFEREVSLVCARSADGQVASYGLIGNRHENHILDVSSVPVTDLPPEVQAHAGRIAADILSGLDYVGVLCVELFLLGDGSLLVNEIAPRVHNSGHLTIEASVTSQFQQQLRAITGLPLGDTSYVSAAAMANLLGDVWSDGEPDWPAVLSDSRVQLHLYGKDRARPGRKMGHVTALAGTAAEAEQLVLSARDSA